MNVADRDVLFAIVKEDVLECAREEGIPEEAITDDVLHYVRKALDDAFEDWSVVVKDAINYALKS